MTDARAAARAWMLKPHKGTQDNLLDAYRDQVLAEAAARVAALPAANDGRLIAASREQILNAITRTGQEG
ncbi:hypothetical protein [Kitasatospora sp. CB02891]|uniref:hypothetical protein n=1 Tax=Kitasatospora sp. CB02891 TaxID=2020329 RepID=UPI000C27B5CE|nr:hypothetical protein [Kitasatospora sp. CB02891]PJN24040.1 hypothetical protein CG736_19275 [Kitasatospora sp. CB02891]